MPGDRDDDVRRADSALFCGQAGTPPLYTDAQLEEIREQGASVTSADFVVIPPATAWKAGAEFGEAEREALRAMIVGRRSDQGRVVTLSPFVDTHLDNASRLDNRFSCHAPVADQAGRYEALRAAGKAFAARIVELTPPGPDQDEAVRLVRSAVHWAVAATACSPAGSPPPTAAGHPDWSYNLKPLKPPEPVDE